MDINYLDIKDFNMPPVSFPQLFAINKGVNYLFNLTFTGIPVKTVLASSGFTFPPFPATNYVNGISSTSSQVFTLSNTTDSLSSSLIYKTGGNLSNVSSMISYNKIITKKFKDNNPLQPVITWGDWLLVYSTAGFPKTVDIYPVGNMLCIEGPPNQHSRGAVVSSFFDSVSSENHSFLSSIFGHIVSSNNQNFTVEFEGFLENLQGSNTYSSFRPIVGFFREHRNAASAVQFNPSGSAPFLSLNGNIIGFVPFLVSGNYTWHAIIVGTNQTTSTLQVFHHTNSNLNAHVMQKLRVSFIGQIITFIANDVTISTVDLSALVDWTPQSESLHAGCQLREAISTTVVLTFPSSRQRMFIAKQTLVPHPFEISTNTADSKELQYHTTGVQLLKKLK